MSTDPGAPSRTPAASACEPYRELIEAAVRLGRNAKIIWQDLVTSHGFSAGYASVKRFVRSLRGAQAPEERVVIETPPRREAQVDYGEGPMVRHPETGKYRRTRLFVMTLGFSRKSVLLVVWKSSSKTWAELHELAFRRLGGVTETVVLDNQSLKVQWDTLRVRLLHPVSEHARKVNRCMSVGDERRCRDLL